MKRKYLLVVGATLAMWAPASLQAATTSVESGAAIDSELAYPMVERIIGISKDMPDSCEEIKLDDNQKSQLKTAYYQFRREKNILDGQIKNAKMDVEQTITDPNSTKDQGLEKVNALRGVAGQLVDAMVTFHLGVVYDILQPEQREPAFRCMKDMKKMWMQEKLKKMCKNLPKD